MDESVNESVGESAWQPLITDPARRAQLAELIVEIVAAVDAWRRDHSEGGEDPSDYAVLRIYTATDDTVPDPDDAAGTALSASISQIGDRHGPGLYGGAARVAFAVGHLSAGEDADTACEMIERSLARFLEQPTENYDLISGLAGIAVPALQRFTDGVAPPSAELVARLVLEQLERLSSPVPAGLTWHTPPALLPDWQRELSPGGYHNLGLAHGIPGIVAILARYLVAGFEVERARRLLDGAMGYLQSVQADTFGTRFVPWLPSGPRAGVRVAWCYGDLGVAAAVLAAAAATGRDDWRAMGLDLARGMASRPFAESQAHDAGLCHGAAGVAHVLNRMAQATGDDQLSASADVWYGHTVAMRRSEHVAGFPRVAVNDGRQDFEPAIDLLTGAAGVALALHAAISTVEPAWDQVLLSDLAPRSLI